MKRSLLSLAAAVAFAAPSVAQAQFDSSVDLVINSHPYQTRGTNYSANGVAGGFLADFELDFTSPPQKVTFKDYLVWCIDPNRTLLGEQPFKYQAFTAIAFTSSGFGAQTVPVHTPDVTEMKQIVGLVTDLKTNWASYTSTERLNRQGSIWALFRGEAANVSVNPLPSASLHGWVVLYNGVDQTLITQVPEPSSVALLLLVSATFGAYLFVRRRRAF
jgi:hypothetical protein